MEEAMYTYLINREHHVLMFPVKTEWCDDGGDWVDFKIYYSTEDILRDRLSSEDWKVYKEDHDIAHCLDMEGKAIFLNIKELFDEFQQHYSNLL